MLRLATPRHYRFTQTRSFDASFGGGEANVAVSLANYGEAVSFITRLPENELGDACLRELESHRVDTRHIIRGGSRLGIYFLESGSAQRPSKVIYDRSGSSFATIEMGMLNWESIFEGADWFHWTGITPAVSQGAADACREAIQVAREMGITVSCDLNYRAKLWKWGRSAGEVMSDLVAMCDVVLGNEEDAEKVFGITAPGVDVSAGKVKADHYRAVCESLERKFPTIKTIAITLRGSISASHNTWSGTLWHKNKFHSAPVYDILPIVDRVGAGDAFVA
ncbi:MAG: sugar kinase, partial [Anaerolineaceae bacterium]|nr:sugar kinase [Anaerolineaceae bacterium]